MSETDITAVIPGPAGNQVLAPHLAVEIQTKGCAHPTARFRLQNRQCVIQIAALHVDLLAARAPICARRPYPDLPWIVRARWRNTHVELCAVGEILVIV